MDRDEAEQLTQHLRSEWATHHHVLSRSAGEPESLVYTDALTHADALGHAAELIDSIDEDIAVVWIVEASGTDCPLAHGELSTEEGEKDGADAFLSNAMAQTPFWMAAPADDPDVIAEQHPASVVKLEHGEDEYAVELGDCMVIVKFHPPNSVDVQFPAGQLEKWQRIAWREDKTVEQVVERAIDAAFGRSSDDDSD